MKKVALLIVAGIIITMMMPLRGIVSLNVYNGEVWNDSTLIAPFDVPITKSSDQINQERQQARHSVPPVFIVDSTLGENKITQLRLLLLADGLSGNRVDTATKVAHAIYRAGIIEPSEADSYRDRTVLLHYKNSHELRDEHSSSLFTPVEAADKIAAVANTTPAKVRPFVVTNIAYDASLSNVVRNKALSDISTTQGVVRRGEVVVASGQIVDEQTLRTINSLRSIFEANFSSGSSLYFVILGRFLVVMLILVLNYLFFTRFAVHYFGGGVREMTFVVMLYVVITGMVAIAANLKGISPYIIPLPIVAIYLLTFFNMRVAIFGNLSIALLCSLFAKVPFDFFVLNVLSGMVAIFMMRHFYHRGKLMRALGSIIATQIVVYAAFVLMREGSFTAIGYRNFIWFLISGLLFLGLYQAIYLVERLFGFVSDVTLLELCDTNQSLLMQLAQSAPGTFQHSVQVANLAESAAKEIGANPLLARTGALYHDIGKMENPFYFVENLSGTFNPHDDCTAEQSVRIIKEHISEGVAIAKRHKLPSTVVDFIESHHGTSLIFYFYNKAVKGGGEVVESDFRYSGPLPVSREVSICMMADAVEAASRSLSSYDKEPLEALVDSVIDVQIRDGQFAVSQLTFQEIARVKELFKAKLNNIYHGRIAYPSRG